MSVELQPAEAEIVARLLAFCHREVEARNTNRDRSELRDLLRDNTQVIQMLNRRLREEFGEADADFASEHAPGAYSRPEDNSSPRSTEKDYDPGGPEWLR